MIEVKVSFDHDRDAAMEATRFWGALGLTRRAEVRRRGPGRDAAAGRRAVGRADREALHRLDRPRRARREDQDATSTSASTTWSSTRPARTRRSSCELYGEEILPRLRALVSASMTDAVAAASGDAPRRCAGPATASRSTPTEAEILLRRAGRRPRRPVRVGGAGARPGPGRRRPSRRRHLLAQGVHPADPAVPRPLPLLHVRHHAEPACTAPFLSPDEVLAIADAGRGAGLQGGAVHPRRPARGPLAGGARVARRARLRLDARLRPGDGDPGARADRAAAAPEPRRHVVGGAAAAQAGRAVDGHDARDDVAAAVRGPARRALRLAGQGPGGAAAGARGRRPVEHPVHHRHPHRHRRDARPSASTRSSRSAGSPARTAASRK